jgi:predicted esterase
VVDLAKPSLAGEKVLREAAFGFDPCVFWDGDFPKGDFLDRRSVNRAVGAYTIRTKFYDADFHEVMRPEKTGRYGAIAEIQGKNGETDHRFVTLFRLSGTSADWHKMDARTRARALAKELGISPEAMKAYDQEFAATWKKDFLDDLWRSDDKAALLAGTVDSKGMMPVVDRTGAEARDQLWWHEFQTRLGISPAYKYVVQLPRGYEAQKNRKFPAILYLHGSGDRGDDLPNIEKNSVFQFLAQHEDMPLIAVAPQCPAGTWWHPLMLMTLLDEVQKKYRVDADRIYLTGFSMGGFGTWETALWYPERFAAIVPICGVGDPADMARLKGMPTWVFHGDADDVVSCELDVAGVDALKKAGGNVKMTVYPRVKHDSWTATYANPEVYKWMLAQKRAEQ